MKRVFPGARIGILGSGQLGRMLSFAAKRMGYIVEVFSPDRHSPAGQLADREWVAPYEDLATLKQFAKGLDIITLEFENIPVTSLEAALEFAPVQPSPQVLFITQNRAREKGFLSAKGFPVTPFKPIRLASELESALQELGTPAILKTAGFGYDGKGQQRVSSLEEAKTAFAALQQEAVLEALVDFDKEVSVVAARSASGDFVHYGVIENEHRNHILELSLAPADLSEALVGEALALAQGVLEALEFVGVMCVEFFLKGEQLLINELAPRPHNSGHLTIEACVCSQFEQQLRAVCKLPLGLSDYLKPAGMLNVLGDSWTNGQPDWQRLLAKDLHLHLYGKAEARPGRKMGHLTILAESPQAARQKLQEARAVLEAAV
jgi:5-(carboxyamino)imidazole ribonucleotide synthase